MFTKDESFINDISLRCDYCNFCSVSCRLCYWPIGIITYIRSNISDLPRHPYPFPIYIKNWNRRRSINEGTLAIHQIWPWWLMLFWPSYRLTLSVLRLSASSTCIIRSTEMEIFCLSKLTYEIPALRGQQHPILTVNSCSWNNRNFIKWQITPPGSELQPTTPRLHAECSNRWATGMWHFPIHGFGQTDLFPTNRIHIKTKEKQKQWQFVVFCPEIQVPTGLASRIY